MDAIYRSNQTLENGTWPVAETTLDLMGLKCPLPVLKTQKAMTKLASGDEITLLTTDPMAEIDIPHFCQEHGHTLLEAVKTGTGHQFRIKKAQ